MPDEELEELHDLEPMPHDAEHDDLEPLEELPPPAEEAKSAEAAEADAEHERSMEKARAAAEQAQSAIEAGRAQAAKAPLLLKNAAMIVAAGCLVPFMSWQPHWGFFAGSKLLVVVSAYLFHVGVLARSGEKVDPTFRGLTERTFVDLTKRPKNLGEQLLHVVPTPLHVIAWLMMIGGIVLSFLDPVHAFQLSAEVLMLAWAAATFVHIDSFERGHKFNPIFPLLFIGHAAAALVTFLAGPNLIQIVGAGVVACGGLFAMYTMFLAMKQAKVQGELKKRAASEHRKLERARRKKSG
jgi:hypothetical protein